MKINFLHGLFSGILAGIAGIIYNIIYCQALMVDFSLLARPIGILASSVLGCLLASIGYRFFTKWTVQRVDFWFNVTFMVLTFLSLAGPFSGNLPLSVNDPELFPGLVVPMHFFPILFWLASQPIFLQKPINKQ